MVFSSPLFVYYYLPLALAVYYLMPRRAKHLALTAFSYLFYGWANPWFTLLMLGSTLVDYRCGLAMSSGGESTRKPRAGRLDLRKPVASRLLQVF